MKVPSRGIWLLVTACSCTLMLYGVRTSEGTTSISKAWQATYVEGNPNKDFRFRAQFAECKVCHVILPKGSIEGLNSYGNAVKKFVTKPGIAAREADQERLQKYLNEGLQRAGLERNAAGKSFQALFDEGRRPWEEPE